jgi:hypothetical protein
MLDANKIGTILYLRSIDILIMAELLAVFH